MYRYDSIDMTRVIITKEHREVSMRIFCLVYSFASLRISPLHVAPHNILYVILISYNARTLYTDYAKIQNIIIIHIEKMGKLFISGSITGFPGTCMYVINLQFNNSHA